MKQYIIDASVAVKWLNQEREGATSQALALLEGALRGDYQLTSPDLLIYEVLNALIRGKGLKEKVLEEAVVVLFQLPLDLVGCDLDLASSTAIIAEQYRMTFYDAVYVALAHREHAPLLTANPKHQGKMPGLAVIDIADWRS